MPGEGGGGPSVNILTGGGGSNVGVSPTKMWSAHITDRLCALPTDSGLYRPTLPIIPTDSVHY